MAWITVDQHLPEHRKTLELARILQRDPLYVTGLLIKLWSWAIDHAKDGRIDPEEDAPSLAGSLRTRPSTATRLLLGAKSVGFIDDDWRFHEWERWAGKAVVDREKDALRKRLYREHRRGEHSLYIEGCPTCVRGTSGGQGPSRNGLRPVDIQRTDAGPHEGASGGPSGGRPGVEKRRVDTPYPQTDTDGGWEERRAQELVAQAQGPWRVVLEQLLEHAQGEGALRSFVTHFGGATLEERGHGYVLIVANALHQDWVAKRYQDQILEALTRDGTTPELVIEVRAADQPAPEQQA